MDGNDLEMTQVIHGQDDSDDEAEREIHAVLKLDDQDAPAAYQTFNLKPGKNMVGRSRTCDVIIENYAVSKQHAIIDVGGHSCTIMDLGSQNKVKIGKRTLKPNCQYNLDYNEEFCIAGLRARILCDQNNGAKSDTGSDTCSESLLTAIEVATDQKGVDAEAGDNADEPEPSAPVAGLDEATGTAVNSKLEISNDRTAAKSQNAKASSSEYQSSGSFTMPEMPNLDYTQTDSSQGTEPCVGADHDAQTNQVGAGAAAPAAPAPEDGSAPAVKHTGAFLCAPTQPYSDDACGRNAGDTLEPATADKESHLNAETQPYAGSAECPEVPSSNCGEINNVEVDETDRLNAPTQAYEDDPSAEAERLNAATQAYTEQDEDERLNAVTQAYTADADQEEEERLNAVTQPYAADVVDQEEQERLNAVTQPYAAEVSKEEEERLNAVTQPYAEDAYQDEHDRLNAVTQSFNDKAEEDNTGDGSASAPTQSEERHRRLLLGAAELSFVLCEASQPYRDDGGDDDEEEEEFCAPTQKDDSPPLKVHALLKFRRERGAVAEEEDDKTPPLSPKTTIDETPPPSPGFVPESDPESDDGETSMVTARHSPSIFDMTSASVYEDCVTPGAANGSPIIGTIKRPKRGMSLKKPTCDTVQELPSQESTAGAEWMQQQQQASSQSKASKKLTYIEEAHDSRDLSAKTTDTSLAELSAGGAEHTTKHSSIITTCSPPKVPMELQESAGTDKKSATTDDCDMPLLHMSESTDLDTTATDKEDGTAQDPAVKEGKKALEACTSSEMPADTGTGTSEQACSRKEETLEKDRPASISSESEEESSRVSRRKGKKEPPSRTTRTKRKVASPQDEKEAPIENTAALARRSSGRQNAGSRMKSLLSLEKRTSASGDFEESALSQEVNDKRDAPKDDAAMEEPQGKAGRSRTRRGLKGKAAAEVPPLPPEDGLASASQPKVMSSSNEDKGENEEPSMKPNENGSEGVADGREGTHADKDECPPKRGSLVDREDDNAEDVVSTASLTPSLGDGDNNCTDATIDTCFSEPFPTFSEVMAECQPFIEKTEGQDERSEAAEAQEETMVDLADESKAEAPATSEPEPVAAKEQPRALRSKNPKEGVATRKRKGSEAVEELPSARGKATRRGARKGPLAGAELLAEDSPGDIEQPEVLQSASPQQTKVARRGRPPRNAVSRKTAPRLAVTNIVENTEQSEGEHDAGNLSAQETESIDGTPSETSESLTPSLGKAAPRPRLSKAPLSKDPKEGVAMRKRKGPEVAEELPSIRRKATRRGAQETPPTGVALLAEDSPGDIEQPEAPQSTSTQQSNKARRGRPLRSAVGRKTAPRVVDTKIVEDTEQSEGEADSDRLSAQETESIEGTPLETSESLTPSRGKAVPRPHFSKAPQCGARGRRQLLLLDAEQADEAASKDESDPDRLSAQDTESINGTPSKTPEELTASEGKAVPSSSKASRRGTKNAKQSLQQDVKEADEAASDGLVAGHSGEQLHSVRTSQRGKASTKTRSGQDKEADTGAAADVSLASVESSQSSQTSRRGKRGVKHSQEKIEPPVQSRLNDSTQSLSTEPQSQTSRSSQLERRNTRQPETQENLPTEETGDSLTEGEVHGKKLSRSGRNGTKLSQEAASKSVANAGESNPEPGSADHELQTRRTRRGRNAAEPSQNKQVMPTPEATGDPSENSGTEAEPPSSQTRRGRKGLKQTRNQRNNKNAPEDSNVKETSEVPEQPNSRSSKPSRTTNLSLPRRTAAASSMEVSVKMEPLSPGTPRRSSTKTAQVQLEEAEHPGNSDSAEVPSKPKRKVTELKCEDISEAEPLSSGSTTRRQLSKKPAPAPVTRKRDARRTGKKEDTTLTSVAPVLKATEEISAQCSLRRVDRKRHVASMSFGVARHESDDDASGNEEETLDEVTVNVGPKSRQKAPVKEVAVKQEIVEEAPVRRGKRKADVPVVKPEVPQKAKSRRDEQTDSSLAPKKVAKVKPKVLFTGIDSTSAEEVVRDLGGAIATNPSMCTHLVTDKFRRTVKALCCIGKGTPIVDVAWIKKCQEAGAFVDHMPHMLLDKKAEKALHFSLRDTLAKASAGGVLRGWSVHATPHVLPSPSDMKEIVMCAGGKYLDNLPARTSTSTTVVVSCKEDLKACSRARNNGVPVVAAEFVLSGLLQHKLDMEAHRLE
ncbi:mediator of DNA damage checkpoint protein 1-like isoform X2 [Dermacentor albipictus]|uniref:mediator of DNA damage checkpoint protein 1-like isoform X2 n=1 Tax=Dermacentor albipictus TaxID=60249 RepID=UPI0038FC77E6